MGGQRGRRLEVYEKKEALSLIDETIYKGARLLKCCELVGISTRTYQRWKNQNILEDRRQIVKKIPKNKLSEEEVEKVLKVLTDNRFRDLPPSQIVPTLADENIYIASESTMYRILRKKKLNNHRLKSKERTTNIPIEHQATGSNQVWSWDITYIQSDIKGKFFYLYMIVDVYSRMIVGWSIHEKESSLFASELIDFACYEHHIAKDELILHSDNGSPMKGATMLSTLQSLGVTPSFSRPRTSYDNPYSESLFKTLKYNSVKPPKAFSSIDEAKQWVEGFVSWYNTKHKHSKINFITPFQRHYSLDERILNKRKQVYELAKSLNPERWTKNTRNWKMVNETFLKFGKKKRIKQVV